MHSYWPNIKWDVSYVALVLMWIIWSAASYVRNNFKPRFRVHKSDVITGKDRCGEAEHFLINCTNSTKVENIEVQLTE